MCPVLGSAPGRPVPSSSSSSSTFPTIHTPQTHCLRSLFQQILRVNLLDRVKLHDLVLESCSSCVSFQEQFVVHFCSGEACSGLLLPVTTPSLKKTTFPTRATAIAQDEFAKRWTSCTTTLLFHWSPSPRQVLALLQLRHHPGIELLTPRQLRPVVRQPRLDCLPALWRALMYAPRLSPRDPLPLSAGRSLQCLCLPLTVKLLCPSRKQLLLCLTALAKLLTFSSCSLPKSVFHHLQKKLNWLSILLNGKSAISLLPTHIVEQTRHRLIVAFLVPFCSCTTSITVYATCTTFSRNQVHHNRTSSTARSWYLAGVWKPHCLLRPTPVRNMSSWMNVGSHVSSAVVEVLDKLMRKHPRATCL